MTDDVPNGSAVLHALNSILDACNVNRSDRDMYVRIREGYFGPLYTIVASGRTAPVLATRLPELDEAGQHSSAAAVWVLDRHQVEELISSVKATA